MDEKTHRKLRDELDQYDAGSTPRRNQLRYKATLETRELLREILDVVKANRLGAPKVDIAKHFEAMARHRFNAAVDTAQAGEAPEHHAVDESGVIDGSHDTMWGRPLIIGETWPSVMGEVTIERMGTYYDDVRWYGFKPADPHVHEMVRLAFDRLPQFLLGPTDVTNADLVAHLQARLDKAEGHSEAMTRIADQAMADAREQVCENFSEGEQCDEDGDCRIDLSPDQERSLHDAIKATVDKWQLDNNYLPLPWVFTHVRVQENIEPLVNETLPGDSAGQVES